MGSNFFPVEVLTYINIILIYLCYQDVAVTASPDSTIRVWNVDNASCSHVIKVGVCWTFLYTRFKMGHCSLCRMVSVSVTLITSVMKFSVVSVMKLLNC